MKRGLRRPSPALVISAIALLVALAGTAIGGGSKVPGKNGVKSSDIARNAVRAPDTAPDSVGSAEIAAGAVGSSELATAVRPRRLDYSATEAAGGSPQTLVDLGELRVTGRCEPSPVVLNRTGVVVEMRSTVGGVAHVGGVQNPTGPTEPIVFSNVVLAANTPTDLFYGVPDADDDNYNGDLMITYRSASKTVTLLVHTRAGDLSGSTTGGTCAIQGTAIPAS